MMDVCPSTPKKDRRIEDWLFVEDQRRGKKIFKEVNQNDVIKITRRLNFDSPEIQRDRPKYKNLR